MKVLRSAAGPSGRSSGACCAGRSALTARLSCWQRRNGFSCGVSSVAAVPARCSPERDRRWKAPMKRALCLRATARNSRADLCGNRGILSQDRQMSLYGGAARRTRRRRGPRFPSPPGYGNRGHHLPRPGPLLNTPKHSDRKISSIKYSSGVAYRTLRRLPP
jgi:hypothetical protein